MVCVMIFYRIKAHDAEIGSPVTLSTGEKGRKYYLETTAKQCEASIYLPSNSCQFDMTTNNKFQTKKSSLRF